MEVFWIRFGLSVVVRRIGSPKGSRTDIVDFKLNGHSARSSSSPWRKLIPRATVTQVEPQIRHCRLGSSGAGSGFFTGDRGTKRSSVESETAVECSGFALVVQLLLVVAVAVALSSRRPLIALIVLIFLSMSCGRIGDAPEDLIDASRDFWRSSGSTGFRTVWKVRQHE